MRKFIQSYLEYLRDNPNNYWFKRKLYGWGWVPVKWQGWLVLFLWVIFFVFLLEMTENKWQKSSIVILLSIILLLYICYKKGEKPFWQWGKRKDIK